LSRSSFARLLAFELGAALLLDAPTEGIVLEATHGDWIVSTTTFRILPTPKDQTADY